MTKNDEHAHLNEVRFARAEQYALATVAFVLTDAMKASGLSQRELAEQMGVSEARVSQVLNATGNPTIKSLARLAEALSCKLKVSFPKAKLENHVSRDVTFGAAVSEPAIAGDLLFSDGVGASTEPDELAARRKAFKKPLQWAERNPDPALTSAEMCLVNS